MSPRRSTLRIVTVAVSVAMALALAEVALWLAGMPRQDVQILGFEEGDIFRADSHLFWRLREDAPGLEVNRLGLRGHLGDAPALPSDFRIACVGDSSTFGIHLPQHLVWGMQLEQILQERLPDRRVASILAALPGWTTLQNRRLYERDIAGLAPTLTVLYVGAWNDLVATVDVGDAQRNRGPRLLRLLARATADTDEIRRRFLGGDEAPRGRRVPLPEFGDNVAAIIDRARSAGGAVIAILPPVPAATRERFPSIASYQGRLRQILDDRRVPWIDGTALLADVERGIDGPFAKPPGQDSLCYHDWIHPSAFGHRVLAQALVDLLEQRGLLPAAAAGEWRPVVERVEPQVLPALEGGALRLSGAGLDGVERVRIAQQTLVSRERTSDHVVADLPAGLPPGVHAIELLGPGGRMLVEQSIEVAAPRLDLAAAIHGNDIEIRADGDGPAGWQVLLWFATERAMKPVSTRAGAFGLPGIENSRPPGRPELPVRFDLMPWPAVLGSVGADGAYGVRQTFTAGALPGVRRIVAQAILFDPRELESGLLSMVGEVGLAR